MKFYDRVNEMQILQENEVQAERSAVFTVLMGRRRVGKTSLITHAMELEFSCLPNLISVR